MEYYEALNKPQEHNKHTPWIFLAGGITGCEEWQSQVKEDLTSDKFKCIILNPRRKTFDVTDPKASEKQITWEFEMLNQADLITFYFSEKTLQPIVLYELGRWLHSDKELIISVHPNYPRKQDVHIQTKLARPRQVIYDSLAKLIWQIRNWVIDYETWDGYGDRSDKD